MQRQLVLSCPDLIQEDILSTSLLLLQHNVQACTGKYHVLVDVHVTEAVCHLRKSDIQQCVEQLSP